MDLDSYTTVVDDKRYVNPETSLGEQQAFMENLKQIQQQNNQEIKTDTYNLGTAIPSNLGGLTGGEAYFTSRYQVPQTNALVADLRATAQAQALNQALQNELAQAKQRYQNAYKAAQNRSRTYYRGGGGYYGGSGGSSGGGNNGGENVSTWDGEDIETRTTTEEEKNNGVVPPNVANFAE